ncbi:Sec-independent protein translocase protein TatB [Paludibacterium sp.]|uniref:Sec-independent protein translocase protein TatB n=1 Tax=Paludibacterium sp. TaxID=1917523 RepID=UPI0025D81104|nr:Sec-independent protein translocase protein TatB [Paludibacterium sp.]MBV8647056.1 twin-arginine translocase subunit TatB [Paludibacterium sp.]
MFDISFGEILLICVVALVVLGPERLPAVARTLGALVARAQRFVASVKADIGQHTELASLAALKQEVQQTAAALQQQLTAEVDQVQQTVQQAQRETSETSEAIEAARASVDAEVAALTADASVSPEVKPAAAVTPTAAEPVAEPAAEPVSPPAAVIDENQLDLFADPPSVSTPRESTQ